jgi:hypothetical protein
MLDGYGLPNHVRPKMMQPHRQMFCAWASLKIRGNLDTTLVVFEGTAYNLGRWEEKIKSLFFQFLREMHYPNNLSKSSGQSYVFSFSRAQRN